MKFSGKIGFVKQVLLDDPDYPGKYVEVVKRKPYKGDVIHNGNRWDSGNRVNGDTKITQTISIVADEFAYRNCRWMRFVEYMGADWEINSMEIERPRIQLTLGGLYNGEESGSTQDTCECSWE